MNGRTGLFWKQDVINKCGDLSVFFQTCTEIKWCEIDDWLVAWKFSVYEMFREGMREINRCVEFWQPRKCVVYIGRAMSQRMRKRGVFLEKVWFWEWNSKSWCMTKRAIMMRIQIEKKNGNRTGMCKRFAGEMQMRYKSWYEQFSTSDCLIDWLINLDTNNLSFYYIFGKVWNQHKIGKGNRKAHTNDGKNWDICGTWWNVVYPKQARMDTVRSTVGGLAGGWSGQSDVNTEWGRLLTERTESMGIFGIDQV